MTGTHRQLVRRFYTAADGLPAGHLRSIAVTRAGRVFVSSDGNLLRLDGEAWKPVPAPANVTCLFTPLRNVDLLAGASDGVWRLSGDRWVKEPKSPEGVLAFASEPEGNVWALARSGVWKHGDSWTRIHELDDESMEDPRALLPTSPQDVFVATRSGLFGLMGKRKYWLDLEVRPGRLMSPDARSLARLDGSHLIVATDKGFNLTNGTNGWIAIRGSDGLPVLDLKHVVTGPDGTVWFGSDQGLIRWRSGVFTYLASKRWLPSDSVTSIAVAPDSSVWAGTKEGLSHIYEQSMTLKEKATRYQQNIDDRERRHGYVTVMHLRAPGVVDGARQEISDNDGLWTALYIASQSYRFAVTQSAEAKAHAWRSMQALLRLESITGISGFPARAICNVKEPEFKSRGFDTDNEWHPSPVEKDWYWKGDTSSDELDGHFFAWYIFHDLAANDEEKRMVSATCKRVMDHILDHGYYLVDHDGKPTTWGVWAPEKLNDDPKWWADRGLNSLEILSHLKVAAHVTGDERYERAYRELITKHHYALNTLHAKVPGGVSHDDQLLFLSYYPLLQLERSPELRSILLESLQQTWESERVEANPLWNFIYGASTGKPCDVEAAVQTLREIPLDLIIWKIMNSHRADLRFDSALERRGIKQLVRPLPPTERPIHKWDKHPYVLDDGADLGEMDPTIWLLPYWMGRHHRFIE